MAARVMMTLCVVGTTKAKIRWHTIMSTAPRMSMEAPLALTVEEVAEERCYGCCTKREHEEHLSCLLGCEVEVALEHVDSVLLEGEDG